MADLASKISFDTTQAQTAIQALENVLGQYDQQVDNLARATQILDKNQQANGLTMRFINAQGKELIATIEKVNGVYKTTVKETQKLATADQVAAQAVKQITQAMKQQAAEAERLAKAQKKQNDEMTRTIGLASRRAQADQLLGRITQPFQSQIATASPEKNLALARAMDTVRDKITRGRFTLQEFEHAFTQFQRVGSSALVGLDKNVASSVFNLQRSLQGLGNTGQNAGQRILLTWAGVARIFVVQQIHRFVSLLSNEFTRATRESINFSLRIAEIETISLRSGKSFQDWTRDIRQLSDAFGVSNTVVAEGVYQGLSNQVITAANKTEFLANAMKLSIATAATFDDGVNILSSAINSYGLSTSESARISGVFFKTVELGRVRLSEMANDFGTIGPLAKKLGITFEETNALISSLTRTGIRYNEVNTIISSIMNELIKPSKELKELFAGLGVTSGEAAIKTFGFAGFMRILSQQSELGSEHLADLFNNVRALRGVIGTTGSGLNEFEKDLKALRENGVDDLAEGFDKIANTDAKKLQIEFNKLKNFFEVDLGIAFQSTLVKIINKFGGLVQIVGEASSATFALVGGWAAYRFALNSGIFDLGKYITPQRVHLFLTNQQITVTELLRASFLRLQAAMTATNVIVGFAVIAISAWIKSTIDAGVAAAQLEQRISELGTKISEASVKEIEAARKAQDERVAIVRDGLEKTVAAYALYLAKVTQVSDAVAARTKEGAEAAADAFKAYLDNIISQLRDAANKAEAEVKRLQSIRDKAVENQNEIRANAAKNQVERDVNVAKTPDEKAAVLQAEIDKADKALEEIIRKGKAASLEELEQARVLAEQKEQYAQRLFELRLQQEQSLSKEELKLRLAADKEQSQTLERQIKQAEDRYKRLLQGAKGGNIANLSIADQREARALQKQIAEQKEAQKKLAANIAAQQNLVGAREKAEKEILAATQQRLDLEKQISAEAEKRRQQAEAEAKAKEKQAFDFNQAATQFIDTKKNAEKTDFKVTETDPAKIKEQLDAQQAAIDEQLQQRRDALIQAAKDAGIGGAQLIELEANVEREITRVKEQLAAERNTVEVRALQEQAVTAANAAKDRLAKAEAEAKEQVDIVERKEDEIVAAYAALQERIKAELQKNNIGDVAREQLQNLLNVVTQQLNQVQAGDANNNLLDNLPELTANYQALVDVLGPLLEKINAQKAQGGLASLFSDNGVNVAALEVNGITKSLGELLTTLTTVQEVADKNKQLQKALEDAQTNAKGVEEQLKAIVPAAVQAQAAMGQMAQNTSDKLPALIARYQELVGLLNQAANVRGIPGVPRWFGGSMQFLATGGRGFDRVPAMLAPGEFVMNRDVTAKNYTQLVALNSGRQPRSFAQGGNVTTVGDINITVQGGDNSQQTVREIGRQLKRNIRLGRY